MYSEKPNLHDVLCSDTADPIRRGRPREYLYNFGDSDVGERGSATPCSCR
jgi:hypothetical protein